MHDQPLGTIYKVRAGGKGFTKYGHWRWFLIAKDSHNCGIFTSCFFLFFFAALPMALRNAEESRQIESHHIK